MPGGLFTRLLGIPDKSGHLPEPGHVYRKNRKREGKLRFDNR